MIEILKIEIYKIFKRPRSYMGFIVIAIIVIIVQLGFYVQGQELLEFATSNLKEKFLFKGNLINFNTVSYVILTSLWIHIPVLIALVTGDLIAGESNAGTFRLVLTRPISRAKLIASKFIAGWVYVISLLAFLFIMTLSIGYLLFGDGDLIVIKSSMHIIEQGDILWRFFYAFLYSIITMTVITSLSLMLSSFSENSIGPIVGTIAIIIGLTVITTLGYTILEPIIPYLFTTYLPSWKVFFSLEPEYTELYKSLSVMISYIIIFYTITIIYFTKKDVLS